MSLQISTFIFMEQIPRSRILGSRGICIFNFNRYFQIAFQKGWNTLQLQCMRAYFPHIPAGNRYHSSSFARLMEIEQYSIISPDHCMHYTACTHFVMAEIQSTNGLQKQASFCVQCGGRALTFSSLWEGATYGLVLTIKKFEHIFIQQRIFGLVE